MGFFDSFAAPLNLAANTVGGLLNYQAVQNTNEANAALWREQSAYNTPANQMARLKAAGLNPNLAYGQIAESRASNPPQMVAPRPSEMSKLMPYYEVKNQQVQNDLLRAQVSEVLARKRSIDADTKSKEYENSQLVGSGASRLDPSYIRWIIRKLPELAKFSKQVWDDTRDYVRYGAGKLNAWSLERAPQRRD